MEKRLSINNLKILSLNNHLENTIQRFLNQFPDMQLTTNIKPYLCIYVGSNFYNVRYNVSYDYSIDIIPSNIIVNKIGDYTPGYVKITPSIMRYLYNIIKLINVYCDENFGPIR